MSWFGGTVLSRMWQPLQNTVRQVRNKTPFYYSEKKAQGPMVRRFGYRDPVYQGGLLPHIESNVKLPIPDYRPKDPWNTKRALFGQNDYIDIMGGDQPIHPTKILYYVPHWLRGIKGNEFQILIRRRKIFRGTSFHMKSPTKWKLMEKRIRYLYRYLNQKTKTLYSSR